MTTELGYEVPLNDWEGFYGDRILHALGRMHHLGHSQPGLQLSTVAALIGLDPNDALALMKALMEQGLIFDDQGIYRLTDKGWRHIHTSPAWSPLM